MDGKNARENESIPCGKEMTCAEIVVKSLEDLGVDTIFGYTGGAILPVFDAIGKSKIKVITNSNEQSCAFSAAGYSRSTNKVGICIVTSGPGVTNTLTAVADAFADSVPLIVIAGQVPEHKIGTDAFQHIDVESVFKRAAKRTISATNGEDMEAIIKESYHLAKSGRPGPIVIDFPMNKQQSKQEYKSTPHEIYAAAFKHKRTLSDGDCQKFFEGLMKSERPLLYIGGGLNTEEGSTAIREFNEIFRIPSVNTLMGKGIIDENDSLSMGMLGMFGTPHANTIIQQNDFFFAVGVRWDDRVADKVGSFGKKAAIAYIDINPEKVREISIDRKPFFCEETDAASAIKTLTNYAKKKNIRLEIEPWRNEAKRIRSMFKIIENSSSNQIQQVEAVRILSSKIDDETIIVTDVGNSQMLAAQHISRKKPREFLTSGAFGTMGFSLPSAIGAQIANPNQTIIAIVGDGGAKMNFGELNTIVNYGLPIKIMLLNNSGDGMVRNLQDFAYNKNRVATAREKSPEFFRVAAALGFSYAKRIKEKSELTKSIEEFVSSKGPALLEIITDFEEVLYPKVPAGKSYSEMILGPHINKISP